MQTRQVMEHIEPSDCVLNTAQMRDATEHETLHFHIDLTSISFANAIHEGIQREIDSCDGRSGTGLLAGGLSSMVVPDQLGQWQGWG